MKVIRQPEPYICSWCGETVWIAENSDCDDHARIHFEEMTARHLAEQEKKCK